MTAFCKAVGPALVGLLAGPRPQTALALTLPIGLTIWAVLRSRDSRSAGQGQLWLKIAMLLGLLLFWLNESGPMRTL